MKLNALLSRKIISVSCGDYHSVALADSGEVFSWGGGGQYNRGQCGHGDLKDQETPKRIDFLKSKKVSKVNCGGYHTIVLTHDNNLYGFGKGEYGQLGYGASEDCTLPKLITFNKKSIQYERTIVKPDLTDNLTLEETVLNNTINTTNFTPVIKDIKCGGEHTVVLTSLGRVYTFGHGYTGQLGLGNTKNFDLPMIVKSLLKKTVNQIAAGWSHTMVLTSEGNVYVSGCGKYGEL
jgi:alpha-tubulin suppressor-like RCC1 family protein